MSGGARVAMSLVAEWRQDIEWAGLFSSAAVIVNDVHPPVRDSFAWYGMTGWGDYNYPELERFRAECQQKGIAHSLFLENTGHGWPSKDVAHQALRIAELRRAIRQEKIDAKRIGAVLQAIAKASSEQAKEPLLRLDAARQLETALGLVSPLADQNKRLSSPLKKDTENI